MKLVCAVVLLWVMASSAAAQAGEPFDSALSMVKALRLGNNLTVMGLRVATSTQTYHIIARNLGQEKARLLITEELSMSLPKFQAQWDRNLAQSYAENFDANELRSLRSENQASKYISKFKSKQGIVGESMREKSSGLLNEVVIEVMTKAYKRSREMKPND